MGREAMDLGAWLEELGLDEYAPAFRKQRIDWELVPELTDQDLRELGIAALGDRKRLLSAIARLGSEVEAVRPAPLGERRQVTVLFADLCGYTAFSAKHDAEEVLALLNRFFEVADLVVQSHGGRVDKHIGDAVMAVFGAPVAHTDDPVRAARAALEMHAAAAKLDPPLSVHIGIAAGQVVASSTGSATLAEYTVTGESVNLAARLTDLAGPGETLASASVQRALGRRFGGLPLGRRLIEGLPEPVQVWRLEDLADPASGERRPLFGRTKELEHFEAALERCRATGAGRTLVLRGEPGIGKTRLLDAFEERALAAGFRCHGALVLDFGAGTGQDAVRALTRSLLDLARDAAPQDQRRAAERALAEGMLQPEDRPHLNDLLGLEQPAELRALYDAMENAARKAGRRNTLVSLLRAVAGRQPRLLRVEDLHWADPPVLQAMATLAAAVAALPVVLAVSTRVEGDPLDRAWREAADGTPLEILDLGPLLASDMTRLAAGFRGTDAGVVRACVARSGGNPLFLEQLMLNADELVGDRIPGSVQGIVQARLDYLPQADREALQAAAILGQRFDLDALRAVADKPDYEPVHLIEHRLVRSASAGFLFAHALIRDGVEASLLRSQRSDLHRRAAAWYEGRDQGLFAVHLDRAGDPGAPAAYLEAAREQAAVFHYDNATRLAERGLAIDSAADTRMELLLFLGGLQLDQGLVETARATFESAIEAAPDEVFAGRARLGLAETLRFVDDFGRAFALLEEAEPALEGAGEDASLSKLHHLRGNLFFPLGKPEACRREHERALELARGSRIDEARALGGLGDAAYLAGNMLSAQEAFERCLEICAAEGFGRIQVANASMLPHTLLYRLDMGAAARSAVQTAEQARAVGHKRAELNTVLAMSFVHWELADWRSLEASIAVVFELVEVLGTRRFRSPAYNNAARARLEQGDAEAARRLAEEGMEQAREVGLGFDGLRLLGTLVRLAPSAEALRARIAEAKSIMAAGCVGHGPYYFWRDQIDRAAELREPGLILEATASLDGFTAEPVPWKLFFGAWGRALAGLIEGDPEAPQALARLRAEAEAKDLRATLARHDALVAALG